MTTSGLGESSAREAALRYLAAHPSRFEMAVLDIQPLAVDAGWVVWPQAVEYLRSHDPMDFVPAQPLLVTAGPTVTPLPTAVPVTESLDERSLRLAEPPPH